MFAAKKLQGAGGAGGAPTWDLDYAYYDDPYGGDVSTASYVNKNFNTDPQTVSTVTAIGFKPDGTIMYCGNNNGTLFQYTLSRAWDVTSASYASKSKNLSAETNDLYGPSFDPSGTKMYVTKSGGKTVYQYSLSTAWDISTASYASKSYTLGSENLIANGVSFSPDGAKMFVPAYSNITQHNLSTPWDISTASYASKSYSWSAQDTSAGCAGFSPDGKKMYMGGGVGDDINYYTLSTAWDVTTASYVNRFSYASQTATAFSFYVRPDLGGFYVYSSVSFVGRVYQYAMGGFSVAAQDATPWNISVKPDGTAMYLMGNASDTVYQYTLGTAWDLSTASYASKNKSVTSQDSLPRGLFFKPDGTKMFTVGTSSDQVYRYALSTAWDLSTANFEIGQAFSVSSQETSPQSIAFNSDGTKMYVVGTGSDTVFQYTLSTAWNLTTASYASKSLSVSAKETTPFGLAFNDAGTVLFVCGNTSDSVHEYALSTAWDVSTGVFSKSFSTGLDGPTGIFFKPDGSKFFLSDYVSHAIFTYSIGNQ